MPERIHIVTCRDPRGWRDHLIELWHTNYTRRLLAPISAFYEASPWVKAAVRRADIVLTPAPTTLDWRIRRLYGSTIRPRFMPYPVEIPARKPVKSSDPLVLFVGRFDRRKRVERFFNLARVFPNIHFTAVGAAHDRLYDRRLRRRAREIPNLELTGFVPRFGTPNVGDYYARAWILVNTAVREGLPYTFMEAAAYGNAILSSVNPEEFASRFGHHVIDDDYVAGLQWLLKNSRWREKGEAAAEFIAGIWDETTCIARHLELYTQLMVDPITGPGPADVASAKETGRKQSVRLP
jgi:glycosyltransferase involved in cell wall biosynthesis